MKRHGFTLIEIMIVVAILALLAGMVGTKFISQGDTAKLKIAAAELKQVQGALDFFKLDQSRYPTSEEGLEALLSKPDAADVKTYPESGYLDKMPKDPWGNTYQYLSPGNHGAYDLWSKGPDNLDDTEDDITSWVKEGE